MDLGCNGEESIHSLPRAGKMLVDKCNVLMGRSPGQLLVLYPISTSAL